jgi:hypothetical protein
LFGLNAAETGLPKPGTLDGVGVNIHFTHAKPGELEMLAAGGFRFVRMDFFWEGIEKEKGVYDFAAYDHLMADLDRLGLRAYFILDYGHRFYDGGLSPHTDDGRAAFSAFVKAAMQRFAGRGIVWEMWNEPNHGMFWKPQPKVDDYVKLALAVGETVREVAPKEILVGPTTSEIDLPFLEACFKGGCLSWWDAVSVHPYRQSPPESAADEYRTLRQLIARHAPRPIVQDPRGPRGRLIQDEPKHLPILSGEWGYTSAKLQHGGFTEEQQARYLPRQWLSNIANGIPISIWYDWHDDGDDRSNPEHNFGTVRRPYREGQAEVYEPKPAYLAAKTLTSVLKGYEFSKALALKDDEHVLLFAKGDQLRLAAWTSAKETRAVGIPANGGRFRVTGHLGQDLPEIIADDKGLTLTLTGDVQYLAPIDANPSLRLAVAWDRLPLEVMVTASQPGDQVHHRNANGVNIVGPAPTAERIMSSFRNPLERTVHVDREDIDVRSGYGCAVSVIIPLGERAPFPQPVSMPLVIDGRTVWTQTTRLVTTNPVTMSILAPHTAAGRAVVPVLVDNRLGTRFHAQFILTHNSVTSLAEHTCEAASERVILLPLAEKPDQPAQLALVALHPQRNHPVRLLPLSTYRTLTSSPGDWRVMADGDAAVISTHTLAPGTANVVPGLDDLPTLDLDYRLERGWKFLRLVPRAPMGIGNSRTIGMWIHGDGSGNVVRMRLVDASGQVFQPDGGKLAHVGWKWTTFTITPHTAHWGGANDGVVKPPLKLDTLLLLDQADQSKPSQGVVRIAGALAVE